MSAERTFEEKLSQLAQREKTKVEGVKKTFEQMGFTIPQQKELKEAGEIEARRKILEPSGKEFSEILKKVQELYLSNVGEIKIEINDDASSIICSLNWDSEIGDYHVHGGVHEEVTGGNKIFIKRGIGKYREGIVFDTIMVGSGDKYPHWDFDSMVGAANPTWKEQVQDSILNILERKDYAWGSKLPDPDPFDESSIGSQFK